MADEGPEWRAEWGTLRLSEPAEAIAPDGSEVRLLCATERGSMAHFRLRPGAVSRAVRHRTVDEVWYIVAGRGRMWRRAAAVSEVITLAPGVSVSIPAGVSFQFRCDGDTALDAVGMTMPPWPDDNEAELVAGTWESFGLW